MRRNLKKKHEEPNKPKYLLKKKLNFYVENLKQGPEQ